MISINGSVPGTDAADKFLEKVLIKFEEKKHKIPPKLSLYKKTNESIAVQSEEAMDETRIDIIESGCSM